MTAETHDAVDPASEHGRLCLKTIAPHTLEVMRDLGTSTSEDIATIMINNYKRTNPNLSGQDTIRRRIYDVINVLSASGIIDKVGKQIVWRGGRRTVVAPPRAALGSDACEERVRMKEQMLSDKVKLLTLYKVLIKRNFVRERPSDAMILPVILLGIKDPGKATFTQSVNPCELEIKSGQGMHFFAPGDILRKISLSKQSIERILALSPELLRYGISLLREIDEKEE
jgi:hypothetical protein